MAGTVAYDLRDALAESIPVERAQLRTALADWGFVE